MCCIVVVEKRDVQLTLVRASNPCHLHTCSYLGNRSGVSGEVNWILVPFPSSFSFIQSNTMIKPPAVVRVLLFSSSGINK